jgi:hypothetical protein
MRKEIAEGIVGVAGSYAAGAYIATPLARLYGITDDQWYQTFDQNQGSLLFTQETAREIGREVITGGVAALLFASTFVVYLLAMRRRS